MRYLVFLLLLATSGMVAGQTVHSSLSAPYTRIGTYSKHFTDAFSSVANQGSLAGSSATTAGIYTERKFLLKELSSFLAAVVVPVRQGGIGLNVQYAGNTDFNRSKMGLAYARKLDEKISLGVQFNYHTIRVSSYGNSGVVTVELGTLWQLNKNLRAGIHVYNPLGGKFGKQATEKLAAVYTMGLGYEASDKFFLSTEIVKEEDLPVTVNAGLQYQFATQFFIRAGILTATGVYLAGAGFKKKGYRLEMVSSFHPQLGFTPGVLLLFQFNTPSNGKASTE
jgi:hypothetical protein